MSSPLILTAEAGYAQYPSSSLINTTSHTFVPPSFRHRTLRPLQICSGLLQSKNLTSPWAQGASGSAAGRSGERREREKSSVRAKAEHVFCVVKGQLKFKKTRYRGLRKLEAKFNIMFAPANLILADRLCLAV